MKTSEQLNEKITLKADEFLKYFKTITREGSRHEIYILENDAPESLKELVREAHGDFFPDDFRYESIHDALCKFSDCNEDLDEVSLEADIYHHDLLRWLSSSLNRITYCDEAKDEFGLTDVDLMTLITYGQQREKDEIVSLIREFLISLCT